MIVSVTERGTFKRCKLQWDYTSMSRRKLTTLIPESKFELGTLVHRALEKWATNPESNLEELFKIEAGLGISIVKYKYQQQVGAPISDLELGDYLDLFELGCAMMKNYQEYWKGPIPDGFRFVQPEQTVMMPVPGTTFCHNCNGSRVLVIPNTSDNLEIYSNRVINDHEDNLIVQCNVCNGVGAVTDYIEGTFDGLLEDEGGRLWILEHKTWDKHPSDVMLNQNDQVLAYIWMLSQLTKTEGSGFYGRKIGGVAYDGMWKRMYPPNKRTTDDLFLRKTLIRRPQELAYFERTLPLEFQDMRNPNIYRSVPWMGCTDCHMKRLCDAEALGEDVKYVLNNMYTTREDTK